MARDMSAETRGGPVARILIALVRCYQLVPRVGPPRCRFFPSCSAYAIDALRLHGALGGTALLLWRLARCHPFHPGGVEHVPARSPKRGDAEQTPENDSCGGRGSRGDRELTVGVQSAGRS